MNISIRRIYVEDAAALATLASKTFFDTFTGTCTAQDMEQFLQETFNVPRLEAELADEKNGYYFAEFDGTPVAYLQIMEDYSSFELVKKWKAIELKRIYVNKLYHGKGVAQLLIQFAEYHAKQQKYQVLWLGVWEHNLRAKRFYEKFGFTDSGEVHDFPIGNTPQTDNYLWKFL